MKQQNMESGKISSEMLVGVMNILKAKGTCCMVYGEEFRPIGIRFYSSSYNYAKLVGIANEVRALLKGHVKIILEEGYAVHISFVE